MCWELIQLFSPHSSCKGHGKPEFEGAQSFLMSCATKSAQRLHWNTGWLSWTELRMQKHRNNRAFSHEVPKHNRHWGYLAHHSMWQVHLLALLVLNSFQISCHYIFFLKKHCQVLLVHIAVESIWLEMPNAGNYTQSWHTKSYVRN